MCMINFILSFLKEKKIEYGPFMEVLYKITAVVF